MSFKEKIIKEKLPKHVAIIMDGNGRWAKRKGNIRLFGHSQGADSVNEVVEAAVETGVEYLTLYAFSTENWNRPEKEVDGLMTLLSSTIDKKINTLLKYNVRLNVIGLIDKLPEKVRTKLLKAIERTKNNKGLTLTLALSYSSRWEIGEMVKSIAEQVKQGTLSVDQINDQVISDNLHTAGIPDPELLIRTSGEYRISNYLLWQIAYAELYFTEVLWPDFKKENFWEAIYNYQNRERRFGKTGEQIKGEA